MCLPWHLRSIRKSFTLLRLKCVAVGECQGFGISIIIYFTTVFLFLLRVHINDQPPIVCEGLLSYHCPGQLCLPIHTSSRSSFIYLVEGKTAEPENLRLDCKYEWKVYYPLSISEVLKCRMSWIFYLLYL